jgi:hypothetical protein
MCQEQCSSLTNPLIPVLLIARVSSGSAQTPWSIPQLIQRRWTSQPGRKGEDAEEAPALQLPRSLSQDFSAVAAAPPAKHASYGTIAADWGEASL